MDIEEIKKNKIALENAILKLINTFEKDTKCFIDDVRMSRLETVGGEKLIESVNIEIKI